MATSLASLHHAWTPKPVPLARKTPPPVGQAATPEDVLAVLPILKSTALLIHCLQSERGVTCGWLASVTEQTLFSEALPVCRAETDLPATPPYSPSLSIKTNRNHHQSTLKRGRLAPHSDRPGPHANSNGRRS